MNLLQSAAGWLGTQLKAAAGRAVTIQQGTQTAALTGTPSVFEYDVLDQDGFATKLLSYDWLFTAADLIDQFGNPIRLRAGATVTTADAGFPAESYEAMPLGSKPPLERADASAVLLVLHTKKIN